MATVGAENGPGADDNEGKLPRWRPWGRFRLPVWNVGTNGLLLLFASLLLLLSLPLFASDDNVKDVDGNPDSPGVIGPDIVAIPN